MNRLVMSNSKGTELFVATIFEDHEKVLIQYENDLETLINLDTFECLLRRDILIYIHKL